MTSAAPRSPEAVSPAGTRLLGRRAALAGEGHRPDPRAAWLPLLLGLLAVTAILSLVAGRYTIPLATVLEALGSKLGLARAEVSEAVSTVLFNVRLPRIAAAAFVGGGLALAGAAYQGLFRNPLVSPDLLGAAAGASFGACVGILLSLSILATQLLAFIAGLVAVCAVLIVASRFRTLAPILSLVLTGILVASLFQALVAGAKVLADPYDKLPNILFWLMGSLSRVNVRDLGVMVPPMLVGAAALLAVRWHLNPLSFDEEEAAAMGAESRKMRVIVVGASTVLTSASVAVCGPIGWVGLVVPHLARSLVGADHRRLLPVSAVLGALFLLVVDDVVRLAGAIEVPVGVLTAFIGAPWFLLLMSRTGRSWR
jgi:iron complex transport system permease protein